MFFPIFFTILFIINNQLLSVKSANEDDPIIEKRLQSLVLLRGNRFYRAENLQNDQIENKGKERQKWFIKSPRNTLNNQNYYIPYNLICN